MADFIPDNFTFTLDDVVDLTIFLVNPVDNLVDAFDYATEVNAGIPRLCRFDRRYSGSYDRLTNFRNYGRAGVESFNFIFGSHLNSFTFDFLKPGSTTQFKTAKLDEGDGTTWFSSTPTGTLNSTGSITVNLQNNNTGSARNGAILCTVDDGGVVRWEQRVGFNQPSL